MNNEQDAKISLVPKLRKLSELWNDINLTNKRISENIEELHQNITNLIIRVDLDDLEICVSSFVLSELNGTGLINQINSVNCQIANSFQEIGFFAQGSSYFTGIFSSDFSSRDNLH